MLLRANLQQGLSIALGSWNCGEAHEGRLFHPPFLQSGETDQTGGVSAFPKVSSLLRDTNPAIIMLPVAVVMMLGWSHALSTDHIHPGNYIVHQRSD